MRYIIHDSQFERNCCLSFQDEFKKQKSDRTLDIIIVFCYIINHRFEVSQAQAMVPFQLTVCYHYISTQVDIRRDLIMIQDKTAHSQ